MKWTLCSEKMPKKYELVWLTIAGTDMIKCKKGETLEQAINRINKIRWVTFGFKDDEGFWCGADGLPMTVTPIAWQKIVEPAPYKDDIDKGNYIE